MSREILYILLPDYAAHEAVYLAQAIASDEFALKENPRYVNRAVAPTLEPVMSIGGFRMVQINRIVFLCFCLLCFLGIRADLLHAHGDISVGQLLSQFFRTLDHAVRHTGNGLEQLKSWGGENYTNPEGYVHSQAVSDGNIVTANGSAALEFAKELLLLLGNDTPERIEMYYQFNKQGFCALFPDESR